MSARRIEVILADDHELVREGLRLLLEKEHGIRVVGEAGTAADAVAQAIRLRADVVIMETKLPDGSGIEACREIRANAPKTQVIILTAHADDDAALASIAAGAAGYFLKLIHVQDLVRAVETVSAGQSLVDPGVTRKLLERLKRGDAGEQGDESAALSAQELRGLALVANGRANKGTVAPGAI